MKKLIFTLVMLVAMTIHLPAQPPPPPPGGDHGEREDLPPKETPIGGGMEVLIAMGLIYGGLVVRRAHMIKKRSAENAQLVSGD